MADYSCGSCFCKLQFFGKDIESVLAALSEPTEPGKPKAILSHTVKGKGVSFMENQVGWHGKAPNEEQRSQALKELEG